jgi:hypothetical protein
MGEFIIVRVAKAPILLQGFSQNKLLIHYGNVMKKNIPLHKQITKLNMHSR